MLYSAQLTINIGGGNSKYTLVCADKNMYGTTKTQGNEVTLYIDSTELLNGGGEIKLASLRSGKPMTIDESADLILVNSMMRPQQYDNVKVKVLTEQDKTTPKPQKPSGSGGGGSSAKGSSSGDGSGGMIAGGIVHTPDEDNASIMTDRVFYDVEDDHWAKPSIYYVVSEGLFDGISDYIFEPEQAMTRAMYVTVLNRFGTKIGPKWQINCETPMMFDDVPEGDWYSDAVAWAGGIGLVTGVGDNCFAPTQSVTREQMALMIANFAKLCRIELPSNVDGVEFADEDSIHDWALSAVHAVQQSGIIEGRDDNVFAPLDTATRAEVATIMHRIVRILN